MKARIKVKKLIESNLNLFEQQKYTQETLKFYEELGKLLSLHHEQLKINIQISTQKIDKMVNTCIDYGALGGKINGSGFGGTMFALMPGKQEEGIQIIKDLGGEGFIIETSNGAETF